jgi:hypothetical protein
MDEQREIGGYFGLEPGRHGSNPHAAARALNSARNCLLYVLLARRPDRLHLPAYLCDSMLEPLRQAAVEPVFYNVGADLEIAAEPALGGSDCLLYVNYFGVKNDYCRRLAARYGPALIVDDSQAFFAPPLACMATLYSPRKFFGVADGGYLYADASLDTALERDVSYDSLRHLAGRVDLGASAFYAEFCASERRLGGRPLRRMSALTEALLNGIDYEHARRTRRRNFRHLHAALGAANRLRIDADGIDGPMVYPFLSSDPALRQRLIARKVYVATYWKEVLHSAQASAWEKELVEHLVPLPIDQRYGEAEMQFIVDLVGARAAPCPT